jgi:radical SAM superfamily enzyme YgiQ (UPF0313 family)
MSVAMLVYTNKAAKAGSGKKKRSFDGRQSIGALIINDALERAGHPVKFCSPETAHHHKIVLVSFTSLNDYFNFLKNVHKWKTWRRGERTFKVIAGGAGMQTVAPVREYVDYAVFGRGEFIAPKLVDAIFKGKEFVHPAVMPDLMNPSIVKYEQVEGVYEHEIQMAEGVFKETVSGCPMSCSFCHYTFARKWEGKHDESGSGKKATEYVRRGTYGGRLEGIMSTIAGALPEAGMADQRRIVTGIDGFSQRLRYAIRKRISDQDIIDTVEESSIAGDFDPTHFKMFQIAGYPTETEEDRYEFEENLRKIKRQKDGNRIMISVHVTPFQASPLSPSAWLPVNFDTEWKSKLNGKDIIGSDNMAAGEQRDVVIFYDRYIETEISHFKVMVMARATDESDEIINRLIYDPTLKKLKSKYAMEYLKNKHDISQYSREYHTTNEQIPSWYLRSYIGNDSMIKSAQLVKAALGMPEAGMKKGLQYDTPVEGEPDFGPKEQSEGQMVEVA